MDSILKNVGGEYVTAFANGPLVSTLAKAYADVSSQDRLKLHKLVATWKSFPKGPLFSGTAVVADVESAFKSFDSGGKSTPSDAPVKNRHVKPVAKPIAPVFVPQEQIPAVSDRMAVQNKISYLLQKKRAIGVLNPHDVNNNGEIQVLDQVSSICLKLLV